MGKEGMNRGNQSCDVRDRQTWAFLRPQVGRATLHVKVVATEQDVKGTRLGLGGHLCAVDPQDGIHDHCQFFALDHTLNPSQKHWRCVQQVFKHRHTHIHTQRDTRTQTAIQTRQHR